MGRQSLSADLPRLFSALTSGARVISGVTGDFIAGFIFADTGAAVTTTDTSVPLPYAVRVTCIRLFASDGLP
jgi:hypothetical protein